MPSIFSLVFWSLRMTRLDSLWYSFILHIKGVMWKLKQTIRSPLNPAVLTTRCLSSGTPLWQNNLCDSASVWEGGRQIKCLVHRFPGVVYTLCIISVFVCFIFYCFNVCFIYFCFKSFNCYGTFFLFYIILHILNKGGNSILKVFV